MFCPSQFGPNCSPLGRFLQEKQRDAAAWNNMFKKPTEVKAQQRISGADRKKLRRNVKERFLQAQDADVELLLPTKADVTVSRLANKVHVYAVEGGPPLLFDLDSRGTDIFPTVYALWKVPTLLPAFLLKGGEVSRFVLGGADLMFPGISIPPEGLPPFRAGEPWSIKVPGNDSPIAVGITAMSCAEAANANFRGRALHVIHYYRDTLWDISEGRYVPNSGFLEDVVLEDPALAILQSKVETTVAVEEGDSKSAVGLSGELVGATDGYQPGIERPSTTGDHLQLGLKGLKLNDATETGADHPGSGGPVITPEEMDSLLDRCLLQALHTSVKDRDLPMPGSTLWSGHILACRPPGTLLDIKKSSHKKLSKWLHSKAVHGLISAKEDKHRKEILLQSVNRSHPDYQAFSPEKRTLGESDVAPSGANDGQQGQVVSQVVELWRPTPHVTQIFESIGADVNKYYTALEASEVIFTYVEAENLLKPGDQNIVVLNATLCDALYKGTVKRGSTYPTEIDREKLPRAFVGRMQANFRVVRGAESVVRKGTLKSVQIMTERRQGNKKVTRVSGTESFLVDADVLATELQKKFACSTSVAELPGKKGQNEVLVQGGVLEDLAKHLVQSYGIPKTHIEILDKTRK